MTSRSERIILVGLSGSGKSTILNQWKLGKEVKTIDITSSFEYQGKEFDFVDLAGNQAPTWDQHFDNSYAVVFVLDSSSSDEELERAKTEFHRIALHPALAKAVFLIFANKQDHANARTIQELEQTLEVRRALTMRMYHIQSCDAVSGAGLNEGLHWLWTAEHRSHLLTSFVAASS